MKEKCKWSHKLCSLSNVLFTEPKVLNSRVFWLFTLNFLETIHFENTYFSFKQPLQVNLLTRHPHLYVMWKTPFQFYNFISPLMQIHGLCSLSTDSLRSRVTHFTLRVGMQGLMYIFDISGVPVFISSCNIQFHFTVNLHHFFGFSFKYFMLISYLCSRSAIICTFYSQIFM